MKRLRLAVLGSGKGSNFSAILAAIRTGRLSADIALVGSDHADAGILERAREAGLPTLVVGEPKFRTRLSPEVEQKLAADLAAAAPDLVVLAGWLRVVKEPILAAFPDRIVNIHPSILPDFRGLEAWKQALDAGVAETGCTVHLVDSGVDTGRILGQRKVPVLPGDTPESLHARIQDAERELFPEVLQSLAGEWPQ